MIDRQFDIWILNAIDLIIWNSYQGSNWLLGHAVRGVVMPVIFVLIISKI